MAYSCKEIIELAKRLSQTQNSKAFDFMTEVHLLNNVYTSLYNDLVTSQAFISEFEFSGNETTLPEDCYKIVSVMRNGININQSSNSYNINGSYSIEGDSLVINGSTGGTYKVKYYPLPSVLTASGDVEYLGIEADNSFIPYIDYDVVKDVHYIYYYNGSNYVKYCIEDKTSEDLVEIITRPTRNFKNKTIVYSFTDGVLSQVLWNGEDVTDYFEQEDDCVAISNDNEHIVAYYADNTIYVYDTDFNGVEVNPFLWRGKYNTLTGLDIATNDSTGGILLCYGDNSLAITTYMPDTVLEFPENTFFDVLIDRLAIQFGSLCGITSDGLQTKLTNDEVAFYASINRSNQGCRIRNDVGVQNARL